MVGITSENIFSAHASIARTGWGGTVFDACRSSCSLKFQGQYEPKTADSPVNQASSDHGIERGGYRVDYFGLRRSWLFKGREETGVYKSSTSSMLPMLACLRGSRLEPSTELNNAAIRAVALDARKSLHTLASNAHPLGALRGPAAELQDAARVETPHHN